MSRRRRRTQQAWVKWVWGISLTTMSTGCCICGRWVPAHDSLYVRKLAPGLLDEARCDQLCGEDARCFEATALVEAGTDPQLVCVGTNEYDVWTAPASGVTSPPNEKPEPLDPASPEVRCAPCTGPGRVASDCAPLEPLAASGEHLVVCFRHNAGQCVLDGPAGRHAEGVVAARGLPETPGAYFAKLAHAERVSVLTFRALARDLSRLGAPRDLIRRARRAAHDEERHYLSMKRSARRAGARGPEVRGAPPGPGSHRGHAIENAGEGCVRETFAAALLVHQARDAHDPEVRRAFARIVPDEIAHARLAADIHRFAMKRLRPDERAQVRRAREAARLELEQLGRIAAPHVEREVGLPHVYERAAIAVRSSTVVP